ncbi:MAG: hypothetical protein LAP38_24065 [Acidobacteriia bacterium]|nr:hypothetical protein [Terriglobia bacterium]
MVRYQTIDRGRKVSGVGRTVNVSSSGLLMNAESELPEGSRMKVTIEWPSLLNGTTPLQLVTIGRVVRRRAMSLAVALEHYQFRTRKRTADCDLSSGQAGVEAKSGEHSSPEPLYAAGAKLSAGSFRRLSVAKSEPRRVPEVVIPG